MMAIETFMQQKVTSFIPRKRNKNNSANNEIWGNSWMNVNPNSPLQQGVL
jgi:hypothetical protein